MRVCGKDVDESTTHDLGATRASTERVVSGDEDVVRSTYNGRHDLRLLVDVTQPLRPEIGGARDPQLRRDLSEGGAIADREPAQQRRHMFFDRLLGESDPVTDLLVL